MTRPVSDNQVLPAVEDPSNGKQSANYIKQQEIENVERVQADNSAITLVSRNESQVDRVE